MVSGLIQCWRCLQAVLVGLSELQSLAYRGNKLYSHTLSDRAGVSSGIQLR